LLVSACLLRQVLLSKGAQKVLFPMAVRTKEAIVAKTVEKREGERKEAMVAKTVEIMEVGTAETAKVTESEAR
jgi:hypothetical protein